MDGKRRGASFGPVSLVVSAEPWPSLRSRRLLGSPCAYPRRRTRRRQDIERSRLSRNAVAKGISARTRSMSAASNVVWTALSSIFRLLTQTTGSGK
jgi:hypothetical protein